MFLDLRICIAYKFKYFYPCFKEMMRPFSSNSVLGQNPKVSAQSQTKVVSLKTAPGKIGSRLDRAKWGSRRSRRSICFGACVKVWKTLCVLIKFYIQHRERIMRQNIATAPAEIPQLLGEGNFSKVTAASAGWGSEKSSKVCPLLLDFKPSN